MEVEAAQADWRSSLLKKFPDLQADDWSEEQCRRHLLSLASEEINEKCIKEFGHGSTENGNDTQRVLEVRNSRILFPSVILQWHHTC